MIIFTAPLVKVSLGVHYIMLWYYLPGNLQYSSPTRSARLPTASTRLSSLVVLFSTLVEFVCPLVVSVCPLVVILVLFVGLFITDLF